jgi:transcriptional antiterminator RfaH
MLRWYLIHTKPFGEADAQSNLTRQGYHVYLPRLLQSVRRREGWRDTVSALFPRYVFLQLCEGEQSLGPVRSTVGVSDIVRFGSRYAIVPEQVIDELGSRTDPDSGLHQLTIRGRLKSGTPVTITMGPLAGLEGVFEREAGEDRVLLLLQLLGQEASVRVPVNFVFPRRVENRLR